MSISTTATKITYVGNNSNSTAYPITFKYFDSDHVTVYADGVEISSGGLNYCTFAGDGAAGTGEFTTSLAYAPTVSIVVVLDVPLDQPVVLQEAGSLPAKTLEEDGFDRLNMQIRRVWRKVQDVLRFDTTENDASTGTADTLIGFNGTGNIEEVAKSTFLATANNLSDVDAATARTNLNVDISGTDNSTDVTLAGTGTYLSINESQVITVDPIEGTEIASTGETEGNSFLRENGDGTCSWIDLSNLGAGNALVENPLSQFATTTSDQLASVISDKTGSGALVFGTSPSLTTPDLGTPSAIDLTNATNYPETNGTTQGEGATTYNIQPKDEGTVAGNARGENSVDLQTNRALATEVAAGAGSVLVGGDNNTASNTNSIVVGGSGNNNSGANTAILGGQNNSASSFRGVILGGQNNVASAGEVLVAGESGTASHSGVRVFADGSTTAFGSIAAQEFAIQASALRLVDGNEGAGKVLTCDANGSGNWAYANGVGDSVTGTATMTNSTNNIALTGVGGLTGLAVGDVIEVTGSTSNNDVFTVEFITDTDNVIVNAEHAGGTTGKSLTDETTASVTVTLVCKANNAPLGYGQGWVDVISSRSSNTNITNTTGRTISVSVSASHTSATAVICNGVVDGVTVSAMRNDDLNNYSRTLFAQFDVPSGSVYRNNNSNVNTDAWAELR